MKRSTKPESPWLRAFRLKVEKTPRRVLRDSNLREYFLVDFFHDAIIAKMAFNHTAQTLQVTLLTDRKKAPPYSRAWGIRLPTYDDSKHYYSWDCLFSHVSHFSLNAILTKVEHMNGETTEENWAFSPWRPSHFEYLGGQFMTSSRLKQHERSFNRKLFHLKMDCNTRIVDVIFDRIRIKRGKQVPHYWSQRKQFESYLRKVAA